MNKYTVAAVALLCQFAGSGPAWSKPEYLSYWQSRYPQSTLPQRVGAATGSSCNLCHPRSGFEWDRPGTAYREMLHAFLHAGYSTIESAVEAAHALDADADGVPNGVEILTPRPDGEIGYHPGLVGSRGVDPTSALGNEPLTGQPETPPVELQLTFVPPVLNFGSVALNQVISQPLRIKNPGTTRQTVARLQLKLQNSSSFSFRSLYREPFTIEAGQEALLYVDYIGTPPGYFYQSLAWLEIATGSPAGPTTTALLSARGGSGPFTVSSGAVHFDVVAAGTQATRSVAITNLGDVRLTLSEPKLLGRDLTSFRYEWAGGFSVSLEPLRSTTITLVFEPTGEVAAEATLRLATDAPAQREILIALDGKGRWRATPGDANRDGKLEITDALAILSTLFAGAATVCTDALDANNNGRVALTDAVYLLQFLFQGGPGPSSCELDVAASYLGCAGGSSCAR